MHIWLLLITSLNCLSIVVSPKYEVLSVGKTTHGTAFDDSEIVDRSITFNRFNGYATSINIETSVSSAFYYPGHTNFYEFTSSTRQCLKLNYSGTNASLKIYNIDFYSSNDYLTSVSNINNSLDCYYFDKDMTYIIELKALNVNGYSPYSFTLSNVTLSTLNNHDKYALHQTFDSSSNIGYHYEVVYFDVSDSTYTATNSNINGYSTKKINTHKKKLFLSQYQLITKIK